MKRQARMALSMEDAQRLQQDIRKIETEHRRQRLEIFAVEDEIEARRDALIAALQKRLHRASRNQSLFVVRWSVVQCYLNCNLSTCCAVHVAKNDMTLEHVAILRKLVHVLLTCRRWRHKLLICPRRTSRKAAPCLRHA